MANQNCEQCRRLVDERNLDSHLEACDGDPRSTCSAFGCGRPAVAEALDDSGGRLTQLRWCMAHDPAVAEGGAGSAPTPGPRSRPSELAERSGAAVASSL